MRLQLLKLTRKISRGVWLVINPLSEFLQHSLFVGLIAMQLQDKGSQSRKREPVLHDFERGELFSNEEDFLAFRETRSNEVGDRLRFACAGRSLDHEVLSPNQHIYESAMLWAVGVVD